MWVGPIPGEALDSWLDAIAFRHGVSRRTVLERCAIAHSGYGAWMRLLDFADTDRIAGVTGCDPAVVAALAFPCTGNPDSALRGAQTLPSSTWAWRAHSRWCPQCLTDTGGRWLLAWRLNWTFVCLTHNRSLQDFCPTCAARQRGRPPGSQMPQLDRCAEPVRDSSGERACCGADLGQDQECVEPVNAAMVHSQRLVNALLAGRRAPLRVYRATQPAPQAIFEDVKIIARYVFTLLGNMPAGTTMPQALADVSIAGGASSGHRAAPAARPAALDIATATAITAAILDTHDVSAAAHLLAEVVLISTYAGAGAHRVYNAEALTPRAHLICERAHQYVRSTLTLRRRYDTTAAKSRQSIKRNRQARAMARVDSLAVSSGTRWGR